jgi:excisionase family DNA binding protein
LHRMNSKPGKHLFVRVEVEGAKAEVESIQQSLRQDRYTVKEVASLLRCHEKTVRAWMKEDKLRYYRPSDRKTYVTKEQLAQFLSRREIPLHLKGP